MKPRFKADFGSAELLAIFPTNTGGNAVQKFEMEFARKFDQRYAVAMPYGRTGLIILLEAMDIVDAEIICPAYTCLVVPEAIIRSGNRPVFVDADPADYNMSFELLETAISASTRAVIVTSIFGHPVNLEKLASFRRRYPQILIIQDCAHSFAASWEGNSVIGHGSAAIFGLNISKVISSVFGGMITTNDDDVARRLLQHRSARLARPGIMKSWKRCLYLVAATAAFSRPFYWLTNRLEQSGVLNQLVEYHNSNEVFMPADYLVGMTELEARVGIAQCLRYDAIIAHRRRIAAVYFNLLESHDDFVLPPSNAGATYSHFVIRTSQAINLIEACRKQGVQLGTLIDYHIPDHGAFKTSPYFGNAFAANLPGNMINLPLHKGFSEVDAKRLVECLRRELHRTAIN